MTTSDGVRTVAFVGSYATADTTGAGGVTLLEITGTGEQTRLATLSRTDVPTEAGFLAYAAATRTLYAVDERKNDGRGPVGPSAAVYALRADPVNGTLTPLNSTPALGPFPTYIALDERHGWLFTASHGSFDHVERVRRTGQGTWTVDPVYDDSTVVRYGLEEDGRVGPIADVVVLEGHGPDPNSSAQAGGHGQASPHAHSVVSDPSGRYLLVGDKGTDRILVFRSGAALELVSVFRAAPGSGPRHLAFDPRTGRVFVTFEFSSELASFDFDATEGRLMLLNRCPTTGGPVGRTNEPADVQVHPNGHVVYVNNRGEDTLVWFAVEADGTLVRNGEVPLSPSVHPGLAARSFAFDPTGALLLLADRPGDLVRCYRVDPVNGDLTYVTDTAVRQPAFVLTAQL